MKIFEAMAGLMTDLTAIGKDQKNVQQGFKYRGIDQVYNAIHPLLAKHKIFTTPEVLDKTREERTNAKGTVLAFVTMRIKYTFWTDDGSSVSCTVEGEGMDSGDKASNKAMAIAHKYALLQTFCIPTEDMDDPDSQVHEVAPRSMQSHAAFPPDWIDLIANIAKAKSMASLKEHFDTATSAARGNDDMLARIVATKDKRKAELTTQEATTA